MSFKESVIIPLSMYQKCQFATLRQTTGQDPDTILYDNSLKPDVKLKLYSQAKHLVRPSIESTPLPHQEEKREDDTSFIVELMPENDQPYVNSILKKIKQNESEIYWNNNLELIIDGTPHANSNIIELLKFTMKKGVITNEKDYPIGGKTFLEKLGAIGVPESWIKVKIARKGTRPKRRPKKYMFSSSDDSNGDTINQIGQGIPWNVY